MGGSASTQNYTSNVTNVYSSVMSQTLNTATSSALNRFAISISGGTGDVLIDNINVDQTIKISTSALFKSVNDASVMQKVASQLQQTANSMVSGLNTGNYSTSSNTIKNATNLAMNVSQTISNNCSQTATNDISLTVNNRDGNITIKNLDVQQQIDSNLSCASESLNKVKIDQTVETTTSQTASATAKGLSAALWVMFLPLILFVGSLMVAGVIGFCVVKLVATTSQGVVMKALPYAVLAAFVGLCISGFVVTSIAQSIINENTAIIAENKKKFEDFRKPDEQKRKQRYQVRAFNYSCGLRNIADGRGWTPSMTMSPISTTGQQTGGSNGFFYTDYVPNDKSVSYTSADAAIENFYATPDIKAMDLIWINNTTFQVYFYTSVKYSASTFTDTNQQYTKIPPIVCLVLDPVEESRLSGDLASQAENTWVFTRSGILFVKRLNAWQRVATGLFDVVPSSVNNIKICMSKPTDLVDIPATSGTQPPGTSYPYYFIDLSKASIDASSQTQTTFTFDVYKVASGALDATNPALKTVYKTVDITSAVKVVADNPLTWVAPFSTNPIFTNYRNVTLVFDPTIAPPPSTGTPSPNEDYVQTYMSNQKSANKALSRARTMRTIGRSLVVVPAAIIVVIVIVMAILFSKKNAVAPESSPKTTPKAVQTTPKAAQTTLDLAQRAQLI